MRPLLGRLTLALPFALSVAVLAAFQHARLARGGALLVKCGVSRLTATRDLALVAELCPRAPLWIAVCSQPPAPAHNYFATTH